MLEHSWVFCTISHQYHTTADRYTEIRHYFIHFQSTGKLHTTRQNDISWNCVSSSSWSIVCLLDVFSSIPLDVCIRIRACTGTNWWKKKIQFGMLRAYLCKCSLRIDIHDDNGDLHIILFYVHIRKSRQYGTIKYVLYRASKSTVDILFW